MIRMFTVLLISLVATSTTERKTELSIRAVIGKNSVNETTRSKHSGFDEASVGLMVDAEIFNFRQNQWVSEREDAIFADVWIQAKKEKRNCHLSVFD